MTMAIADFRPEHAAAFGALNRAWLVEHDLLEPVLTGPAGERHPESWGTIRSGGV